MLSKRKLIWVLLLLLSGCSISSKPVTVTGELMPDYSYPDILADNKTTINLDVWFCPESVKIGDSVFNKNTIADFVKIETRRIADVECIKATIAQDRKSYSVTVPPGKYEIAAIADIRTIKFTNPESPWWLIERRVYKDNNVIHLFQKDSYL